MGPGPARPQSHWRSSRSSSMTWTAFSFAP
jgi:hypothetical protein